MQLLKPFPLRFIRRLRLSSPWNYKVPFLIAIPYYFIQVNALPFNEALRGIFFSLVTIIGIAGFGYLCNDLSDAEADSKAGKSNIALDLKRWQVIALLAFFTVVALLPWIIYFPMDDISFWLLGLQFFLFIIYTAPPLRLKERGFAGVITDALYAHVNPALLAAHTFHLASGKAYANFYWFVAALGAWQLFLGIRNILLHQLKDAGNDSLSGIRTFVTQKGEAWTSNFMRRGIIPLEVLSFICFLAPVTLEITAMAIAYPVFLAFTAASMLFLKKINLPTSYRERLYVYLDDFYIGWIPLVILAALCFEDYRMAVLLIAHVCLFKNPMAYLLSNLVFLANGLAAKIPRQVNKSIK